MTSQPGRTDLAFDTARLRARALCDADERLFITLYCDPEIMRFIATPLTPERAAQRFRAAIEDNGETGVTLTVIERVTGHPIGICSLYKIDRIRRLAESGIILLPEYQALGYAQEGVAALVTKAFAKLPINEITARVAGAHSIAQRVVINLGFTRRSDLDSTAGGPGLQVWSASRSSWPQP